MATACRVAPSGSAAPEAVKPVRSGNSVAVGVPGHASAAGGSALCWRLEPAAAACSRASASCSSCCAACKPFGGIHNAEDMGSISSALCMPPNGVTQTLWKSTSTNRSQIAFNPFQWQPAAKRSRGVSQLQAAKAVTFSSFSERVRRRCGAMTAASAVNVCCILRCGIDSSQQPVVGAVPRCTYRSCIGQ